MATGWLKQWRTRNATHTFKSEIAKIADLTPRFWLRAKSQKSQA
jgi:hypothetical protein